MPFGLLGAPATFQCYINSTLSKFLDIFCSAYIDNILIYLDGSYKDYIEKVYIVIACLREAGLYLDIDKCKFATKEVKYLGFIISTGEGIKVDPREGCRHLELGSPGKYKRSPELPRVC